MATKRGTETPAKPCIDCQVPTVRVTLIPLNVGGMSVRRRCPWCALGRGEAEGIDHQNIRNVAEGKGNIL